MNRLYLYSQTRYNRHNDMKTSEQNPLNFRHMAQIARRKNITKVRPSGKVYNRKGSKSSLGE
jgi:hypothetical protein